VKSKASFYTVKLIGFDSRNNYDQLNLLYY